MAVFERFGASSPDDDLFDGYGVARGGAPGAVPRAGQGARHGGLHGWAPGAPQAPHPASSRTSAPGPVPDIPPLPPAATAPLARLVTFAGAALSIGLIVGMAVWAWQLMVRDVADVPVIRALEGPMRVAPDDPGGAVAENQGLAVNRLAEGEEAAPVPDQLVLAPGPVDIGAVAPALRAAEPAAAAPDPAEDPAADRARETAALIDRLLAEAQQAEVPSGPALPSIGTAPGQAAGTSAIPISVPGLRRSPRPLARPAALVVRPAAPETAAGAAAGPAADADAATAGAAPLEGTVALAASGAPVAAAISEAEGGFEIAAADLPSGTRLVQLGVFDTPELARAEWARLTRLHPDFFLGRARVVEGASSAGQTFYRLRAHGFGDLSASRRFCAALVAEGAGCIPVTVQ